MTKTEDDYDIEPVLIGDLHWTKCIQDSIDICVAKWGLTLEEELPMGLVGYLVAGKDHSGRSVVLKLRDPGEMYQRENAALGLFDGQGVAKLLDLEPSRGAVLLERITPGHTLRDKATDVNVNRSMMTVLHALADKPIEGGRLRDAPLMSVEEQCRKWADKVRDYDGMSIISMERRKRAANTLLSIADEASGTAQPRLIHGDLHMGNVIEDERTGWTSIDPKGFVGPLLFELAWWLRDPPHESAEDPDFELDQRASMMAEAFEVNRLQLLQWAGALSVLISVVRSSLDSHWDAARLAECSFALDRLE